MATRLYGQCIISGTFVIVARDCENQSQRAACAANDYHGWEHCILGGAGSPSCQPLGFFPPSTTVPPTAMMFLGGTGTAHWSTSATLAGGGPPPTMMPAAGALVLP